MKSLREAYGDYYLTGKSPYYLYCHANVPLTSIDFNINIHDKAMLKFVYKFVNTFEEGHVKEQTIV